MSIRKLIALTYWALIVIFLLLVGGIWGMEYEATHHYIESYRDEVDERCIEYQERYYRE